MNRKRIFALAFAVLMVLALAACGMKNNDKMGDMSGNGSAMTGEPKNAEEALALHKELLEQENAILSAFQMYICNLLPLILFLYPDGVLQWHICPCDAS